MPLRPIDPETGRTKALDAYSPEEAESHINQVIDEQRHNAQANRPIDNKALDAAAQLAKKHGHSHLKDRLADADAVIAAGPQPTSPPRGT